MEELLEGRGIVYGSYNNVLAWHEGLPGPVLLASRSMEGRPAHIAAVAYQDGNLFDADYEGVVRYTINGRQIGHKNSEEPILALDFLRSTLIAGRHVKGVWSDV